MTTQTNPRKAMNAFDTAFKHRVVASQEGDFYNPIDAVNPSLERAAAIADLIEVACELTCSDSFETDSLWRAAQAIRLEIKDAQTLLNAYVDAKEAGESKMGNPKPSNLVELNIHSD